jgi:hypothetical protein
MKSQIFFVYLFSVLFASGVFAGEKNRSYCLIYVSVDNESDLNAVEERVNQLTNEAIKSGSAYLLYISRGSNPIVTIQPDEGNVKIKEIFSFGSKPVIFPDQEIQSLFKEISHNDFAYIDANMNTIYLVNKIRFHFIISKDFLALNYQQKIIGTLLSCCMLDKVKEQDCDFLATVHLGKDISARELLDKKNPLGSIFPFSYNKNLTDDN